MIPRLKSVVQAATLPDEHAAFVHTDGCIWAVGLLRIASWPEAPLDTALALSAFDDFLYPRSDRDQARR